MLSQETNRKVHAYITDLMEKVRKEPCGKFPYPTLTTTAGQFYSVSMFTWDCHHMTLRYASAGEPEIMKYFFHTILKFQRSSGFTSCCVSSADGASYSSGFHAQPYLAQNAAIYLAASGDAAGVECVFEQLEKYLAYWLKQYSAPYGLFRWGEVWMSGFDNEIAASLYPPGTILAPDLASLLYLECRALAFICSKTGRDGSRWENEAEKIKKAVNDMLWDEEMETYSAFNMTSNRVLTSYEDPYLTSDIGKYAFISCPSLLVLYAGIAPKERAERMIRRYVLAPEHFRSPWGIRSLSKSSEYYNNARWGNANRYGDWKNLTASNWQGPVWIPLNWFVFHALLRYGFKADAQALADDTVDLLALAIERHGSFHENFHGETGEGLYADNFASWNILGDIMHKYLNDTPLDIFPWENIAKK